ncbi:MAG: HupE/UreJ family protein [Pseudomonadales bacterium]|nr:HupE/UreJ family protein [Pseudomonadales bacterium]
MTIFTLGHSITLMLGVLVGWNVNVYLVDARLAVFVFGLCHGLGLATKL